MSNKDNVVDMMSWWFEKQKANLGIRTEEELALAIERISEKIKHLEDLMNEIRKENNDIEHNESLSDR